MPDTTPLGIPRPLPTDAVSLGDNAMKDAADFIDALLTGAAPAWGAAAAGAIVAGTLTSMGSIPIPIIKRRTTLFLALICAGPAAGTTVLLTPNYANSRADNIGAIRFQTVESVSFGAYYFQIPLAAGTDVTAMGFSITPVGALAAGARLRGWIT